MLASSARDSGTYCGKDSIKTLWGLATFLSPSHCSGLALSGPPKWPSLSPPPTLRPTALALLVQEKYGITVHPRSIERGLTRTQKNGGERSSAPLHHRAGVGSPL